MITPHTVAAASLKLVVAAALALATLEGVIRNVQFRRTVPAIGCENNPEAVTTVLWRREGYGLSHWNADGVRSTVSHPQASGAILAVGDSFTEAHQVNDDEAYTSVLERRLKAGGANLPVLNLGVSGGALPQYIEKAKQFQAQYSPRWTVIQLRDWDLTKEAWSRERPIHFERDAGGEGIHIVGHWQGRVARSKLYQTFALLCNLAATPRFALEQVMAYKMMADKEPPLFKAGYAKRPATEQETDFSPYSLAQELKLAREAYNGKLTILYIAPYDPKNPMDASPMEGALSEICKRQAISFATTRTFHARFKARNLAPFGFPNTNFNVGHCNRDGHQAIAELLADELAHAGIK